MAHKSPRPEGPCPNCGHPLQASDRFCANCGQENHDLKVPLGHLLYELVEGFWHFDNKFFKTLAISIAKPGQVVLDFLEGRRARYVPPIRLYIFVSVIFFFLLHKCTEDKNGIQFKTENGDTRIKVGAEMGPEERSVAEEDRLHEKNEPEEAGEGISLGDRELSNRGIWISTTSEEPQRTIELRMGRIGFAGLALPAEHAAPTLSSSYTLQRKVFLKELRRVMLAQPDMGAYPNWSQALDKALAQFSDALALKDGDTLFLSLAKDGRYRLRYQPRFFRIPTDSLALRSYLSIEERAEIDSLLAHHRVEPSFLNRIVYGRLHSFYNLVLEGRADNMLEDYWLPTFYKDISISMFLLMPAAGFFLLIFFYMRRKYYYEHLIFSIYSHSLVFLLFSISMLVQIVCKGTALESFSEVFFLIVLFSAPVYFLLSLHRVYQQGWGLTLIKSIGLLAIYLLFLTLLTIGILIISFATF